ncbi:MAG TPA: arginine--tRNA ligase, partial [Candidatus Scatomorpha stercorigallinarum]|nr:arginine--tRNA ligase [Candidatus Scatomorpha stercorigallinarum]
GDGWLNRPDGERRAELARFGLDINLPKMKSDLARYGIQYDQWFFESTLHESGYVAATVDELTARGWTYESEGALWLASSRIMADELRRAGKSEADIEKLSLKDDVLRRANGIYTYFAADIAYHRNKFAVRGFDRVINIWGADHHGHVARLKGALDALGIDPDRLDIVLMQLVKLMRDGEVVRMSKRTGKAISLGDLLDEIPVDAARWFFNARPETQMDFDLGLAVREDSENPVYYVQYAHARICSILRNLAEDGHSVPDAALIDAALLSTPQEREVVQQLAELPEEILRAARTLDPSRINRYVTELAARFHRFYNTCRIKGEQEDVLNARLLLADCVRSVIANCLGILGVHAPTQM